MSFPVVPDPTMIAQHFCSTLSQAHCDDWPYRHWMLAAALPVDLCVGVMVLPIRPPLIDECGGVRDLDDNNNKRIFFTPKLRADFLACEALSQAFQKPEVARALMQALALNPQDIEGSFLRIEYIQDTDGAWLAPHPDIPDKLFSMVIYLCTGPEAKEWGTDIYDAQKKWVGRAKAEFNSAVIFVRSDITFHGFEKRPIIGVRRLMEINYVRTTWRDRSQLAFPTNPITLNFGHH